MQLMLTFVSNFAEYARGYGLNLHGQRRGKNTRAQITKFKPFDKPNMWTCASVISLTAQNKKRARSLDRDCGSDHLASLENTFDAELDHHADLRVLEHTADQELLIADIENLRSLASHLDEIDRFRCKVQAFEERVWLP